MSNFSNYMRHLRVYRARTVQALNDREKAIGSYDYYKGSQYYEDQVAAANKAYAETMVRNRQAAKDALIPVLAKMREDAGKNIVQQPTADMANTLSLLKLTDRISPTEFRLYAEQMRDCPLALRVLRQIAAGHKIFIAEPDNEIQLERINRLEDAAVSYLTGFDGTGNEPCSVRMIDRFLHAESEYINSDIGTAEQADSLFLQEVTGNADRAGFEANASRSSPAVHLKFKNLDELLDYIHENTKGEPGLVSEVITQDILQNCPDNYGAAYRNYKATGEKIPIEQED